MQILRIPLLACATAICVTPLLVQAYDNENQLRARQALEQKMKELATQPVPAETSAPPVVVTKPAPAPAPAKKATPTPKPEAKPKTQSKAPAAKQTPAPAVVQQKPVTVTSPEPSVVYIAPGQAPKEIPPSSSVLITPGEPARPVPPIQAAPSAAPAMPEPATPPPAVVSTPVAPAPVEPAKSQQLQNALHQKMSEPWQQPYVAPPSTQHAAAAPKPAPSISAPAANTQPPSTLNLPPLTGPASSLSASKEQRLEQLLQLYRADQITPQEYHAQRAKILSEP